MFKNFNKRRAEIIEKTDPDRVYVENVRSFFNIPYRWAKFICRLAVKHGIFKQKFAVECKNESCKRFISVYDSIDEIPNEIECLTCQLEGKNSYSFKKDELNIVEFYQYTENGK